MILHSTVSMKIPKSCSGNRRKITRYNHETSLNTIITLGYQGGGTTVTRPSLCQFVFLLWKSHNLILSASSRKRALRWNSQLMPRAHGVKKRAPNPQICSKLTLLRIWGFWELLTSCALVESLATISFEIANEFSFFHYLNPLRFFVPFITKATPSKKWKRLYFHHQLAKQGNIRKFCDVSTA